jgi:hypothetical protein
MRRVAVGALFVLLPLSVYASPLTIPAASVVMPDTPSGKGDPNTIVCRAPQRLADSDQFGPKACGYNSEWWQLTAHGKDLAPDGKTVIDRRTVANPNGSGNPDAVTCRAPMDIGGSLRIRHYGPEVCETNQFWADLNKSRKVVDAHGVIVSKPTLMPTIAAISGNVDPLSGYRMSGGGN